MDSQGELSFRIEDVTVDLAAGQILDAAGRPVPLRHQSFEVLRQLVAGRGRVLGKEELISAVWPGIAVTDDSLVQCIHEIRRALGPKGQVALQTVPRRGYRLVLPQAAGAAPARTGSVSRRQVLVAAGIAGCGLAVAALLLRRPDDAAVPPDAPPVIAVMPFDDTDPANAPDHLGASLAETIIAMLSRCPEVATLARRSSFALRDERGDLRTLGRKLGADYVLEGSVRRDGSRLRVTARLDAVTTGRQVWAARFDAQGSDPLVLADAVAGRIIAALSGTRGEVRRAEYAEAWGRDRAGLGEYDYAMRAQDMMLGDNSARGNAAAAAILAEGLAKYPDSAAIKVKLAWNDWRRGYNFWSDDIAADFDSAARQARALEAIPDLPPWVSTLMHWLLGYVAMREGDWGRVLHEVEVTTALAPYDAFLITDLAELLAPAGAYDRALANIDFGAARNPADADYQHALRAWVYRLQGRLVDSVRETQAAHLLAPYQRLQYAITLVRLNRMEDARAQIAMVRAQEPGFGLTAWRRGTFHADPAIVAGDLADLAAAGLPQ